MTAVAIQDIEARHFGGPTVSTIKVVVASQFSVTVLDMESSRRSSDIAFPRHVAMYLCRELTALSLPEIGRRFGGRDHSSVMYACDRIASLLQSNQAVRKRMEDLRVAIARGRGILVPTSVGTLDDVAGWAMEQAARLTKTGSFKPISGDYETVVRILREVFGEEPRFTARDRTGGEVQTLVSPEGSWTRIEVLAETATIVDGGTGWSAA